MNLAITNIKSKKARNLIRGLQDKFIKENHLKTLNRLRITMTLKDTASVTNILFDNPLYSHLEMPEEFPNQPSNSEKKFRPVEVSLEKELVVNLTRIFNSSEILIEALKLFGVLNKNILEHNFDNAIEIITVIKNKIGHSFWLLKKIAFIYSHAEENGSAKSFCLEFLIECGLDARNFVALGLVDTMSETYDYISLRKNLRDLPDEGADNAFSRDITKSIFRPICTHKTELASRLQSHAQFSLIDSLYFIATHSCNVPVIPSIVENDLITKFLTSNLANNWNKISKIPLSLNSFYLGKDSYADFKFYRQSIAWFEVQSVSNYRNGLDHYYETQEGVSNQNFEVAQQFTDNYFRTITSLKQLGLEPENFEISLDEYNNELSGIFTKTVAFIYALGRLGIDQKINSEDFLTIMNTTRDVAQLANANYLEELLDHSNEDLLLKFIISVLQAMKSGLGIHEHKLRRLLQEIVVRDFSSDLMQLFEFLYEKTPFVAQYVFEFCDEAFLSQLYMLFETNEDVYETRALLMEWVAVKYNEPQFAERAKTMRIDQKLQRIRGEIDDTRIFVDPIRFNQWLEDHEFEELSSILHGSSPTDVDINKFEKIGDFAQQRKPEVRLAMVIDRAFKEFCANTRFGIASYLGRRIRHGTLKGVMLEHLREIPNADKYTLLMNNRMASQYINDWLARFEVGIKNFGDKFLQINSDQKPHGAFDTNVYSREKLEITKTAIKDIFRAYSEHGNLPTSGALIFAYCWRLIDVDLKHIQNTSHEDRLIQLKELKKLVPEELEGLTSDLCRELKVHTDEKFKVLYSWFSPPKNFSPSAPLTLLFTAVMDEVKGQFITFSPEIKHSGTVDVILTGGAYHLVYDALKVAIHNAAKYGAPSGDLVRKFELIDLASGGNRLNVTIASQLPEESCAKEAAAKIQKSMEGNLDDVQVVEGQSGLRKLLDMKQDDNELIDVSVSVENHSVIVTCVYDLLGN